MKRYRVSSGDMGTVVCADSYEDAVEKALKEPHRPHAMLGKLIGVQDEGEGEEERFIPTEPFLQKFRAKLGRLPKPRGNVPSEVWLEWGLRETGMTETQMTRHFMSDLIDQGKNPFTDMPTRLIEEACRNYPDIVARAHIKFGFPQLKPWWKFW